MKKFVRNLSLLLVIGLLIASFIPFQRYWVDDRWVYGVDSMSEIYPEIHQSGHNYGNGIILLSSSSSQTMKLNFWQIRDAEKAGALGEKYDN